ncbi:MAG: hypothetical protein RRA92_04605 [Gemmatimonadota bacterium]|nr:hypothetical protein [Gemmatimonadota bacterium]
MNGPSIEVRTLLRVALLATLAAGLAGPPPAAAQTMPVSTRFALERDGHGRLAERIAKRLELRADPDQGDVEDLLARWQREAGGPDGGWDWITVARLWLRAGDAVRADAALERAEAAGGVPASVLRLDRARAAFQAGDLAAAERAYWEGCDGADDAVALEYWLDVEPLATPVELEEWDRLRRLPAPQRDLRAFLRAFWTRRAVASALSLAERMALHYERMGHAMDLYRRRGGKKGPTFSNELGRPRNAILDDRGLLYVRMGPPDRVATFAGNPSISSDLVSAECYQPNESWAYDYPDGTRVFHFSAAGGTDDYWLVDNLGLVYRCGDPEAAASGTAAVARLTPINEFRSVPLGQAARLVLTDLYRSRQGLDPWYAVAAQRMAGSDVDFGLKTTGTAALESTKVLEEERDATHDDGRFAVATVPERPAVTPAARLIVEELQFRGAGAGITRVWMNALVEAANLEPETLPDGTYRYRLEARWALADPSGAFERYGSAFEARTPRRLGPDESLPVRLGVDLPVGRYRSTFVVREAAGGGTADDGVGGDEVGVRGPKGNYRVSDLTVRRFDLAVPELSDVAVAPDSGGTWSPGGDAADVTVGLRPSPVHVTGAGGAAFVYFETYGITPGAEYTTRIRLRPLEGDGPTYDLSFPGEAPPEPAPRLRRLLRVDLADARPGAYRMSVTVTDGATGESTLPYESEIRVRGVAGESAGG